MNLWPERAKWAEVNLCDYGSMKDAVMAFANWQQVLNVYGPAGRIAECRATWDQIRTEDEYAIPPSEATTWVVQEGFEMWETEKGRPQASPRDAEPQDRPGVSQDED